MTFGSIAQLGEHLPYKQRVIGSSPIVPTSSVTLHPYRKGKRSVIVLFSEFRSVAQSRELLHPYRKGKRSVMVLFSEFRSVAQSREPLHPYRKG